MNITFILFQRVNMITETSNYSKEENKKIAAENEQLFQDAFISWNNCSDDISKKMYWDKMFYSVLFACQNITKGILAKRNVKREDSEDKALDAACYCMKFIAKGVHPDKLSSYCYLRCVKFLQLKDDIFWDKNVQTFGDITLGEYKNE